MNNYAFILALLPILFALWQYVAPHQSIALGYELKRRYRRYLIRKYGNKIADEIHQQLKKKASTALGIKATEIVMKENRDRIVEQYGTIISNQILGEPDRFEHTF